MKILIYIQKLNNGGAERVAVEWAKCFVNRGYDVAMVTCCGYSANVTYDPPENVVIYDILPNKSIPLFNQLIMAIKLRHVLKVFEPDKFICVHGTLPHILATLGLGIDCINTEHNVYERPTDSPMPQSVRFRKFVLNKFFHKVTTLTSIDAEIARRYGINAYYLPNPLAFTPVETIPDKKKIILAAGRIDAGYVKGFDILIKAFAQVHNDGWILKIAGSGTVEDIDRYKKLAKKNNIEDKVVFLGYVNNPIKLYQESAIFVLSSRYEGFGLVLIEAMSQGCASIACDYGGRQLEIVGNNDNAICCEPNDAKALALAINSVIENKDRRCQLQKNGIERSKVFLPNHIVKRWEEIFEL